MTGGLAYGDVKFQRRHRRNAGTAFSSVSNTHVGWTVGAGIEGVIGGNWTATPRISLCRPWQGIGSFLTTLIGDLAAALLSSSYSSHITDNVLRVGVNYKFTGPVVAKY